MPANEAQREFDALVTAARDTHADPTSTSAHSQDRHRSTASSSASPASHDDSDDSDDHRLATDRPSAGSTITNPAHMPHSTVSAPVGVMPAYHIPATIYDANTGPKGVIADAQSFEKARRRTFRQTLYAFSNGLGFGHPGGSSSANVTSVQNASRSPQRDNAIIGRKRSVNTTTSGSSTDVSADEDEEEFMRTWRASRMAEMEQGANSRTRRHSPSKRRFGHVTAVDPVGYLDAVEKVAADTIVVVLIADDESPLSSITENALSDLARKHEFTRFVKMGCVDAEMDRDTVPAVLAYRAGDLIANLVPLVDEIPQGRSMSAASLEGVLQKHKILS